YYFGFYDPLLGGLPTARNLVLVGWGEELGPVAAYLNGQPNAAQLSIVAPRSVYDAFGPQVAGNVVGYRALQQADYVLTYANAEQRGQVPPPASELVLTVRVNSVNMARL